MVSEGDSWFDYPFYSNVIDFIDDAELFAHYRLEESGSTLKDMVGKASVLAHLRSVIEEVRPVCCLFSGGGNDLAAAAPKLFRAGNGNDPQSYLVQEEVTNLFDNIRDWYTLLIKEVGPLTPIFAHGYDYFTPADAPVRFSGISFGQGPWIFPAMTKVGITGLELRRAVAAALVDRFQQTLQALESSHPSAIVYVELKGCLDIDHDWQNEIHPNRRGFEKVADRFIAVIKARLPEIVGVRLQGHLNADD